MRTLLTVVHFVAIRAEPRVSKLHAASVARKVIAAALVGALLATSGAVLFPSRWQNRPLTPPTAEASDLAARLRRHVEVLAGEIGPRHLLEPESLGRSRSYILKAFHTIGYATSLQEFEVQRAPVANIEAQASSTRSVFVVGAHYDTVPTTPGANDNASGVAVLLEVARLTRRTSGSVAPVFVAFVNEEPPWFQTESMGSWQYAKRARNRGDDIVGMISLETMGYYSDEVGSQQYPAPFHLFLPRTGYFLAAVSNFRSLGLLRRFTRGFRNGTPLPLISSPAPEWIAGVGWSDQWSFWKHGYPAVMLTDTAPYRYPHYHAGSDTPDKLDYARLAAATLGVTRALQQLTR